MSKRQIIWSIVGIVVLASIGMMLLIFHDLAAGEARMRELDEKRAKAWREITETNRLIREIEDDSDGPNSGE